MAVRVLTVVYSTQNYWLSGLAHRPEFESNYKNTFQKLSLFPSSGEKGRHLLCCVPCVIIAPICACSNTIFTAYIPVTSHGLILVLGVCIAAVMVPCES
jgi:hypothetical protein